MKVFYSFLVIIVLVQAQSTLALQRPKRNGHAKIYEHAKYLAKERRQMITDVLNEIPKSDLYTPMREYWQEWMELYDNKDADMLCWDKLELLSGQFLIGVHKYNRLAIPIAAGTNTDRVSEETAEDKVMKELFNKHGLEDHVLAEAVNYALAGSYFDDQFTSPKEYC